MGTFSCFHQISNMCVIHHRCFKLNKQQCCVNLGTCLTHRLMVLGNRRINGVRGKQQLGMALDLSQ